jgi:hypothetical protein
MIGAPSLSVHLLTAHCMPLSFFTLAIIQRLSLSLQLGQNVNGAGPRPQSRNHPKTLLISAAEFSDDLLRFHVRFVAINLLPSGIDGPTFRG